MSSSFDNKNLKEILTGFISIKQISTLALGYDCKYYSKLMDSLFTNDLNVEIYNDLNVEIKGHIIISNHVSFYDFMIVSKLIECYCVSTIVDKELDKTKKYLENLNIIPYYYEDKNSGEFVKEEIKKLIDSGKNVLVFPEGDLQDGNTIGEFKRGLFHLAYDNKIPILSCNIIFKSKIDNTLIQSMAYFFELPLEEPTIKLYTNEFILPGNFLIFDLFYSKCFTSVRDSYENHLKK